MILLIAKNTVKEDRKADFLRVAALLAEESRKEAGKKNCSKEESRKAGRKENCFGKENSRTEENSGIKK